MGNHILTVMPTLVAGIHALLSFSRCKDVDGRDIGEGKRCRSSNGYARP